MKLMRLIMLKTINNILNFFSKCTRLAEETEGTKKTMGITSGACSILSGICFIVSCSWFASQIYQDFGQPSNALNPQFVYGACLYLGKNFLIKLLSGLSPTPISTRRKHFLVDIHDKKGVTMFTVTPQA